MSLSVLAGKCVFSSWKKKRLVQIDPALVFVGRIVRIAHKTHSVHSRDAILQCFTYFLLLITEWCDD